MRRSLPCLLLCCSSRWAPAAVTTATTRPPQSSQPTSKTTEEPSPSAQRKALKDTATKPVIPKPAGSPPRKLVEEDIVKGKGPRGQAG